jgi:hypothetical protein
MSQLSFIQSKNELLLNIASGIMPSADRYISVVKDDDELIFTGLANEGGIEELVLKEKPYVYDIINRLREKSVTYEWINPEDLPFDSAKNESADERDLFSEKENVVLLIRIPSDGGTHKDLLFIYFRKNLSNFGLSRVDKDFSTDHKDVVGYLVSNAVLTSYRSYVNDHKRYRSLNDNVKMLIRKNERNISELDKIRENYGESLLNFCTNHLKELSARYKRNFALSEDAIRKIRSFSGNLTLLKMVLEDAASFVSQVYYDDPEIDLRIHEWELNFEKFTTVESTAPDTRRIDNRESRAMQLLDKLDKAAEEVIRNRMPLTSVNVGQHCPTPITAPAITDALKKNRRRILDLLKKYPDKWRVIRYQFRPLKNLLEKESENNNLAV